MPKHEGAGLRQRIPAVVASATAATIAQASRLLEKAQKAVPLRRTKKRDEPATSEEMRRDDTH
jgi:hypothetical protein